MLPSRKGRRTGQSTTGAAILVALIAALIVLYILFLPPAQRAALLGDPSGPWGPGTPTDPTAVVYTSPVGLVTAPVNPSIVHELPTVTVRTIEEGSVLFRRDTAIIENNVFEKNPLTATFTANPSSTRNAYLSMNVAGSTGGRLVVTLNGEELYNEPPRSRTIPPIVLTGLAETNDLAVHVSDVGFAFWKTNRISLADVRVTADVTDFTDASVAQRFTIGEEELRAMQTSLLSFVPICNREGSVMITVNGAEVFSGRPDCQTLNTLEIAPTRLVAGENTLRYTTTNADILLDRGRVTTTATPQQNKQFTFTLDPARVAGRPVMLRIYFADANEKQGFITLNGNRIPFTGTDTVAMPVTTALRAGVNSIGFEASQRSFEIVRFEIVRG